MKTTFALIASFVFITSSLQAGEKDFPKIGSSYQITYIQKPEGYFWPDNVKIIERGSGSWCLVEFSRELAPPHARSEKTQGTQTPEPKFVKEQRWINFDLLLAAQEEK